MTRALLVKPSGLVSPVENTVAFWPMDGLPSILDHSGRGNHLSRFMKPAVSDGPFRLGATSTTTQALFGALAKWGGWRRLLTTEERAALLAGEAWPFNITPSLRDAAVFYPLDDSANSATYVDATGRGNDLVRGANAITQVAGPLGTDLAARFGSAGPSSLTLNPPTADVAYGNSAHSISGWALLDSLGTTQQAFWGQAETAADKFGNVLYYFSGTDRLQSDFAGNDILRNAVIVGDSLGAPGTGVWCHLVFEYDPSANVETLYLNGIANTLAEVQRPAPRVGPTRTYFEVPPKFLPVHQSGWDNVGSQCFASHEANTDLSFGPNTKAVWGCVRFSDFTTTQTLMGFLNIVGVNVLVDWVIQQAGGFFYFILGDGLGGYDFTRVAISDTAWHRFVCWSDIGMGKIGIDLDNGAKTANTPITHTPASLSTDFMMGACLKSTTSSGFDQQLLADIGFAGISNGLPSISDFARLAAYGGNQYQ